MFSADITWSPLAENGATGKEEKEEADRNKDAESLESKASTSSKRLRWPFSRKPEKFRNTHSSEDTSGSTRSSPVELPADSVLPSQVNRIQRSSTHLRYPLAAPTTRDQYGNELKADPGALPSVHEVFELPASTKVEKPVKYVLDHTRSIHKKHSSDISSSAILNQPRAPSLAPSSSNHVRRSLSATSSDTRRTNPR
jgi:hypothetical protein